MNILAIILLEVQAWKAILILTLTGAFIAVILLDNEHAEHFFDNLGKTIQRKLRHKKQKNMKQKTDVKEHELPNIWFDN